VNTSRKRRRRDADIRSAAAAAAAARRRTALVTYFQRVYDSLPNSVFDRVGVLRELLFGRYGYCYHTVLSVEEIDSIVEFLCLQ